ncbi:MAG: M3 family metallopeptidase [Acidimicrobiia bacterium]
MLPDFTKITAESLSTRTEEAIARADDLVAAVATADRPGTFDTTLGVIEAAARITADAYGVGPFMARVHPDPEVRAAAVEWEERLSKWATDLVFRDDLAATIRAFAMTEEAMTLSVTRRRLLDHWLRDLRRAGHDLDAAGRARLQELRNRLVELEVKFGANLDEFEDGIEVTRDELDGLPDDYVDRLDPGEAPGTYRVTMAYPDYQPFMQQARNRELRRVLQHKFWNRASIENRPLLEEAVSLRDDIAALLGRSNWPEYAMELKMAEGPAAVVAFYDSIVPGLDAKADLELASLRERLSRSAGSEALEPWDLWFLDDEQRREEYGVDQNEVAAFFRLEDVVGGMFDVTGDVFGLAYRKVEDPAAWHPDVALYEIRDGSKDEPIAYFYADLFPREGKYGHAAAFSVVYGREEDGRYRTPVAIVANFTKPTEDSPSLLRHDEAVTLFHEFGHILHFCLTTVDLVRFSGFDTEWDFVEAPSQIMEHWMWQPEVLRRFARHHVTGEPIPEALVARLVEARDLNIGLFTLRQVFLGKLDLGIHAGGKAHDLDTVYREAFGHTRFPFHEDTFFPASFGHLMGGYDAGYYGYLWSKVYGDDMFSAFEEEGVLDPGVGSRYRAEILATGGSRDASDHLRAFLGREPSSAAFLRNLGLDG